MQYVGIQTQIDRNNRLTVFLLLAFPAILLGMVWVFIAIIAGLQEQSYDAVTGQYVTTATLDGINATFLSVAPWVVAAVAVWFMVAYLCNVAMINHATEAEPITRRDDPRLYNIVENLCMAAGMDMPKLYHVRDNFPNAYASGISRKTYAVTVTDGLCQMLDDDELAGVIGHELTHIRNRDTRLLITSIVFVGIVSTVLGVLFRMFQNVLIFGGSDRRDRKNNGVGMLVMLLIGVVCCAIAYLFTLLTRFAISRKREYMADAGAAELTGNPRALASALAKISGKPGLSQVGRDDVAQLFIVHPLKLQSQGMLEWINSLFSTHPETSKRIAVLMQF